MAYGSQLLTSASPSNLQKFEVVQNMALRIATGAWKSTYIPALQSEANIPPLDIYLQNQCIKYYYKIKTQQENNAVKKQIFNNDNIRNKIWTKNIFRKPFVLKCEEYIINWNLPITPNIEIKSPVIPPWLQLEELVNLEMDIKSTKAMGVEHNKQVSLNMINEKYRNFRKAYTDGSKAQDDSTGAGYYIEDIDRREYWKLENQASIVCAELTAIKRATHWIKQQTNPGNIAVLTDSQTSLHLIRQRKVKSYKY